MLPTVLSIVFGILFALAAVVCVWLFTERKAAQLEKSRLTDELSAATAEKIALAQDLKEQGGVIDSLKQDVALRDQQIAVAEETKRNAEVAHQKMEKQHQAQIEQLQKHLREQFKAAASDALKQTTEQFQQLAKKSFDNDRKQIVHDPEQRKLAVKAFVDPLTTLLNKQQALVQQIEAGRKTSEGALKQQLGTMAEAERGLREETAKLVRALRRPEVRGKWGEMQLKRVAELAGMIENCDFTEQVTLVGEGAQQRPDMVVQLPSGRSIVVDAKAPLDAFINAIESETDADREALLEQHASQIEKQVTGLSRKDYFKQFERSPEFVVLFIPGESFLYEAVQRRPNLLESAMQRNVVIATPTILISLLKAVALGWREQQLAENARQISELGIKLHERLGVAVGHLGSLGGSLEKAVDGYNKFVRSLETRVMVTAREFKELGAKSNKELPAEGEIKIVTKSPMALKSPGEEELNAGG